MKYLNGNLNNKVTEAEELGSCINSKVILQGAIYKIRNMKGFSFLLLRTKRKVVQCIYSKESSSCAIEDIKEQMWVRIYGEVVREERSKTGYEVRINEVEVLSRAEEEFPVVINNKTIEASMETLLDYRMITLRNEKERAIFKIQEGICMAFRQFFQEQRFTEIHTPKIVHAGAEGGANIFHLNYFGKDAYLAQSPQFYKQMMVGVFERVYEIAPVFRAEKHDTRRHLNEYTSVDFEMGFIESFMDIMKMETAMLSYCFEFLNNNYSYELQLLNVKIPVIEEIPYITFYEAKDLIFREYQREIKDMDDFEPEEEQLLYELIYKKTGSEFVFVTHYPSKKRPFYAMEDPKNSETTLSFDLLFRGLEITTGGQRIHEYEAQIKKMEERGMDTEAFHDYLKMHKYGMPPHGGLGLGLERFTAMLLGFFNIRSATLFPRDINRVTP